MINELIVDDEKFYSRKKDVERRRHGAKSKCEKEFWRR